MYYYNWFRTALCIALRIWNCPASNGCKQFAHAFSTIWTEIGSGPSNLHKFNTSDIQTPENNNHPYSSASPAQSSVRPNLAPGLWMDKAILGLRFKRSLKQSNCSIAAFVDKSHNKIAPIDIRHKRPEVMHSNFIKPRNHSPELRIKNRQTDRFKRIMRVHGRLSSHKSQGAP